MTISEELVLNPLIDKPNMQKIHLGGLTTIGQRLHALRCFYSLSVRDLERFTGVSKATLSRMERDKGDITINQVKIFASFYEIDLMELIA